MWNSISICSEPKHRRLCQRQHRHWMHNMPHNVVRCLSQLFWPWRTYSSARMYVRCYQIAPYRDMWSKFLHKRCFHSCSALYDKSYNCRIPGKLFDARAWDRDVCGGGEEEQVDFLVKYVFVYWACFHVQIIPCNEFSCDSISIENDTRECRKRLSRLLHSSASSGVVLHHCTLLLNFEVAVPLRWFNGLLWL